MLPSDESLLPPLNVSIGFFTAYGAAVAAGANLIHQKSILYRPHTLLVGAVFGALGGYVLHHGAHSAHQRLKQSSDYKEKLQVYLASRSS